MIIISRKYALRKTSGRAKERISSTGYSDCSLLVNDEKRISYTVGESQITCGNAPESEIVMWLSRKL